MNNYELIYIVDAALEEAARKDLIEKFNGIITANGGEVVKVEEWGKQRLAYEIQKMNEGYYYFIPFEAEPEAPLEIEGQLRIMDNVLRYLIVRTDEK